MAVTEFTTSPAGAGKTYKRCPHFLVYDFLPLRKGTIWTNFPVHVDALVDFVCDKHPDLVRVDLVKRIQLIPQSELDTWRKGKSGPWEYFKDIDISGGRIAIDEIHNFIPKSADKEVAQHWQEWLGEIRHMGCEFECLSQNESKVHKLIKDEAGLKRHLFNAEQRRDPFFHILMSDWYNMRAKFITGQYVACAFEVEMISVHGKWKESHNSKFTFEPELFKLYDSFSTPIAGGTKARAPSHPYLEKSRFQLLYWFLKRNWWQFLWRVVIVFVVIWICLFGGGSYLISQFINLQRSFMIASNAKSSSSSPSGSVRPGGGQAQPGGPAVQPGTAVVAVDASMSPDKIVSNYEAKVRELKIDLEKAHREIQDLKEKLDRDYDIIMITESSVVLRGGLRLKPGQLIPAGKNSGKVIQGIDYANRCAILSDKSILYLVR